MDAIVESCDLTMDGSKVVFVLVTFGVSYIPVIQLIQVSLSTTFGECYGLQDNIVCQKLYLWWNPLTVKRPVELNQITRDRSHWDTLTADPQKLSSTHTYQKLSLVMMASTDEQTLLNKLSAIAPASLANFDAFPKLTTTYRTRSESRGFMTLFVVLLAVLLLLNDLGEFLWGWPDYEFSVDRNVNPNLEINLDMVVAMPCSCEYFR